MFFKEHNHFLREHSPKAGVRRGRVGIQHINTKYNPKVHNYFSRMIILLSQMKTIDFLNINDKNKNFHFIVGVVNHYTTLNYL
jgi:hypothetical protein